MGRMNWLFELGKNKLVWALTHKKVFTITPTYSCAHKEVDFLVNVRWTFFDMKMWGELDKGMKSQSASMVEVLFLET